ncbi:flavodoxin family protein [bacterium]|nr:flavodoxin family protein [bacterium]
MSKNILILNGSPRKHGNTSALTAEFIKGAKESGNNVVEIFLDDMNINGCKGCFCGGKDTNSPCVQKDDMLKIYPTYQNADIVVLASPMYYWNISGQLKTAFDRLFAIAECYENYENPKKESMFIMTAEGDDFKACEYWYDCMVKYLDWTDIGKIFCGGVMAIGDIKDKKELKLAYEKGKSIN